MRFRSSPFDPKPTCLYREKTLPLALGPQKVKFVFLSSATPSFYLFLANFWSPFNPKEEKATQTSPLPFLHLPRENSTSPLHVIKSCAFSLTTLQTLPDSLYSILFTVEHYHTVVKWDGPQMLFQKKTDEKSLKIWQRQFAHIALFTTVQVQLPLF